MIIQQGIDGAWYAVWSEPNAGFDFIKFFSGASVACFGGYMNAIQLTSIS